ncbi:MAG: phosphate/phosphite/phosphonate ABC transporter substrate-binding protein [Gammaproteobacteria bacterium]
MLYIKKIPLLLAILFISLGAQPIAVADINIGVLAPRGKLKAMNQWKDFGLYMQEQLGQPVTIIPLSPPEVVAAANNDQVALMLANPVHTVKLIELHNSKLIATLNKKSGPVFAGVIVANKGSGIKSSEDLKGKNVMSLKFRAAAGAYTFQAYHLFKKGIDPHKDFASMNAGKKQDDLVLAVKAGVIDAAFIRTGILESMEKEGKIKMNEFHVVDQHGDDEIKLVHTTDHYPEWYFTAMHTTDPALANTAKQALLSLNAEHPASKQARINGFVEPVPLEGMVNALKALKIAPYNN